MGDVPMIRDQAENLEEETRIHGECSAGTFHIRAKSPTNPSNSSLFLRLTAQHKHFFP